MRIWLLSLVSISVLLAGACVKGTPYYKDAQANATPELTPTPKPDDSKPFRDAVAELTKVPSSVKLSGDGYIKGKAARYRQWKSLDDKSSTWSWDSSSLPISKAETPADVETVVLEKCIEVSMGTFVQKIGTGDTIGEKIPAFGWKCDVTIIDKTIPAVVGRKSFESEINDREVVQEGAKEIKRSMPIVEMNKYLKNLPKQ